MVKAAADGTSRASTTGGGASGGNASSGSGGSGSRLPRDAQSLSVSLIHQRIDVAINLDAHSLAGSAEITLQPHVPVASIQNFKLHAHGLDIHSVTVDGTPAKFSTRHWSYVTPSGWSQPEVMADLRNRGGTTLKSLEANELDDGELVISNPSYVPPPPPTPTKPAAPAPGTLASLLKPSGGDVPSRPSTPSALVMALEAAGSTSPPKPKQMPPPPSMMPSSSPVPPSSSMSPSPPPPPQQPPDVPMTQPSTAPLSTAVAPTPKSTGPAADPSTTAKPTDPAPEPSAATPTKPVGAVPDPSQPTPPAQPQPIQASEPKSAPKPPTYPPLRLHVNYSLSSSSTSPTVVFTTDAHGHSYFHTTCLPQPASSQVPGLPIGGTARHWMPCIDRIHERGAWDVHASVVPESAVVAATGRLVSKVTPEGDDEDQADERADADPEQGREDGGQVGEGVVRYHYRVDDPIGAPLVALAASTAFEERMIPLDIPVPDESPRTSYEPSNRHTPVVNDASTTPSAAGKSSQSATVINPGDLIKPRYPPAAIRVYYPTWVPAHLVDHATHIMSATLDYYSNAFGMYPWGEFGEHRVVFAPEVHSRMYTNHGAGVTVLDAQAWLASVSPEMVERTFEQRKEIMTAFAYQWFGCFVLPKNWGDFWCILGLCQFMSGRLFRLHFGHSEFTYRLKRDMERLAVLDVHMPPLYWSPHPSTDFLALKSGLIMYALDKKMTKVAASAGVASMIHKMLAQGPASLSVNALAVAAGTAAAVAAKHARSNAGNSAGDAAVEEEEELVEDRAAHARRQAAAAAAATAQLMVLSNSAMVRWARKESSADGLKGFFEQWVSTPGVPRIQFEYSQNNGRQVIEFDMSQQNTSQWARKQGMRGLFTGTVTVKVFEIDGEVYTHTLDIARPSQHFEVRFNSRYKYKKMLGKTTDNSVPSIEEQSQPNGAGGATGDTDWVKQVAGEGSSDAAANAEAQKRWIQWVWVDPEGEWPCPILLIQPDYKWLRLLTHSPVSVLSQFDVMAHLRDHPSVAVAKQLFAVATSVNVYYRLRLDAVSTLAMCATSKHDWIGLELLAKILRQFAVPVNAAHQLQIAANGFPAAEEHASDPLLKVVPLPQVWDQRLEDYLVFRATVAALVSIRDHMGRTPRQIKQLAINLLTYTDAPAAVGSGVDFRAHIAFLTQCLCEAMVDTPTPAARAAAAKAAQVKIEQIKVEQQQQQAQGASASPSSFPSAAAVAAGTLPSASASAGDASGGVVGPSQAQEPPRPSLIEETASRFAGIAETMDFGLDDFDDEDDEDDTSTMMSQQTVDVDPMQVDDQATSGAGDPQGEDRMDVDGESSASMALSASAAAAAPAAAAKPKPTPQGIGRFALDFEPCPELVDEALSLLERFRMLELVRLTDENGEHLADADEGGELSSSAASIDLDDGNLTATLLSCFCRWMIAGLVPTRLELFLGYTETGLPLAVRKIAFQSIVLLNGFLVLDIARYLMAVIEDDPSPSMRIFVANLLANIARLAGHADKYDFQDTIALTAEAREQLRVTYTEFVGTNFMDAIYKLLASPTMYRDIHVLLMDTARHLYFHQGPAVRVKFPVGTAAKHTPLLLASPAALFAGVPYAGAASLLSSSSGASRSVAALVPPPFRPPPPPRPASPPRAPGSRGWHPAYQGVSPNQKVGSISPTMYIAGLFILESLRTEAAHIDGFLEPVSPLDFPDYYKLITDPMDVSCVDKRFRNGHYTHVDQMFADVDKIWRNCFIFNDESSAIAQSAKHLSEKCESKIKPGARAIMASADEMRQQPRTITEDEVRKIKRINRKMRESYVAGWFKEPVRDVPGYYDVIKAPMDLTTVRRRIEHHEYPNRGCFDNDTRQIFRNCEQFNPPGSQVRDACDVLKKLYNEEFAREFPEEKRVLKIRNTMPGMRKRSESPQVKAEPVTDAPMGMSVPPITIKREPSFNAILSPPPLFSSSHPPSAASSVSAAASLPSPPLLPPPPPRPPSRSSAVPAPVIPLIKPLVVKAPKSVKSEPGASLSQPTATLPAPNRPAQPPREVERTSSLPVFKIRAPARPPAPPSSSTSAGSTSSASMPAPLVPPPQASSAPSSTAPPSSHKEMYSMLKRLYGHDKSLDFRSPVDVVLYNIPTYPKIIKQPMDLQTMFKKLDAGSYKLPLEFFDDLLLTCRNAITFNQVGTIVHEAAKEFYDEIKREFRTTFGASNLPRLSQVPKGKIDHNPPRPTLPAKYMESTSASASAPVPAPAPVQVQARAPEPAPVARHQPHISVLPPPLPPLASSHSRPPSQPPQSHSSLPPLPKSTPIVRAKFSIGAPSIPREPTPSPAASPIVGRASMPASGGSRTSLATSGASTSSLAPLATASSSTSSLPAASMSAGIAGRTRYDVPMTPWHRFRLIDDLNKVTISTRSADQKRADPFLVPVDPMHDNLPQYLDYVSRPMDLGTMRARLVTGWYRNVSEVVQDINQVYENCMLFNGMDNDLTTFADEVRTKFLRKVDATLSDGRGLTPDTLNTAFDTPHPDAAFDLRLAGDIVRKLKAQRHAGTFWAPVDPVRFNIPQYPEIIQWPMDFGTIEGKVKASRYNTMGGFVRDVFLVFDNCFKFNNFCDMVYVQARQLQAVFHAECRGRVSVNVVSRLAATWAPPRPALRKRASWESDGDDDDDDDDEDDDDGESAIPRRGSGVFGSSSSSLAGSSYKRAKLDA